MIKPIFRLFEMQIKSVFRHAVELLQSPLGERPETFDAVDVRVAINKFVSRMIDTKMLPVTDINQPVVSANTRSSCIETL